MTELENISSPRELRRLIRNGGFSAPTTGLCPGYAQANLLILPIEDAYDFLLFAQRNPKPCPLLEVSDPGERFTKICAQDCDIAKDFPLYRIYKDGALIDEPTDVEAYWQDDLVSFIIGCSFSFESELVEAGIEMRHNTEGKNVSMYKTNIDCIPAGKLSGKMVCSMRPLNAADAIKATLLSGAIPAVHGCPIHIGDPSLIGIKDISKPDYGDAVNIAKDELPVFWACGVTPQSIVVNSKPKFAITHAPGYMLVTDTKNINLRN